MRVRPGVLLAAVLLVSTKTLASTEGASTAVTGSPTPVATAVSYGVASNKILEVMGIVPVVSTVTGTPASMAASVTVLTSGPFNLCGSGSTTCSNDLWAAQWTIVSAPTGIQALNAYQGSTIRLANNSASGTSVSLRCQVGNMTGSCIFVTRLLPIADPLF